MDSDAAAVLFEPAGEAQASAFISQALAAEPPEVVRRVADRFSPPARPNLKRRLRQLAHLLVTRLPWRMQDRIYFLVFFGRLPNLRAPTDFNEKVLYRKSVYGDHETYRRLSDKFAVRDYIAAKVGRQYLIPLLYDTVDPETLLGLPQWRRTVIKSNHGSGMVEVLLDEPDEQRRQALLRSCAQWLKTDFSQFVREIHYRGIPPRILVEQYIGNGSQAPVDYKFHMFRQLDGSFQYVLQVIYSRLQPPLAMTFFVNNLHLPFHGIRDAGLAPPCAPTLLAQALELSQVLAADFDYVRVDWYVHEDRVYFGELTFTPGAGLVTGLDNGLDRLMGQMWIQHRAPSRRPRPRFIAGLRPDRQVHHGRPTTLH